MKELTTPGHRHSCSLFDAMAIYHSTEALSSARKKTAMALSEGMAIVFKEIIYK